MSDTQGNMSCTQKCWIAGIAAGVILLLFLMIFGSWTFLSALFAGVIVAIIVGAGLSWTMCSDSAVEAQATHTAAPVAAAPAPSSSEPAADVAEPAEPEAPEPEAPEPEAPEPEAPEPDATEPAVAQTAEDSGPGTAVKSNTLLSGEEELAGRKGSWTYGGGASGGASAATEATSEPSEAVADDAAPESASSADVAPEPEPAKSADATPAPEPAPAADAAPAKLDGPRDGGPDDLKKIKGVGPKLEGVLHAMGYFHFDQVASWSAADVAWADQNLVGFKGRVSRDNWVGQAQALASGEETEFSKRVEKGGVY